MWAASHPLGGLVQSPLWWQPGFLSGSCELGLDVSSIAGGPWVAQEE